MRISAVRSDVCSSDLIRFAVFFVAMIALSRIRPERWSAIAFPAYAILFAALVAVEVLGVVGGGSQRWLDLGLIRLQPSEFMKPAIILVLARFYSRLPEIGRALVRESVCQYG